VELPQIQSISAVKVFCVVIQYFVWKHGGLQLKLVELWQKSNEAAETVAQYIKETLEKSCLFLIYSIYGFLTICYFSKLFLILKVLKM
jgi:hypothetical protein